MLHSAQNTLTIKQIQKNFAITQIKQQIKSDAAISLKHTPTI